MKQEVFNGNNLELLKQYPDNYFDAIVTDPPYGLGKEPNAEQMLQAWITNGYLEVKGSGFMGKEWDAFVPQPIFWKEVFRTLKHGGHVVSFFGTRTYDWGVMAMRLAGFEVRDCIQWVYGSGFPKSHNISKAIDKMYGAEREVVGEIKRGDVQKAKENGSGYLSDPANRNNEKQFGYGLEQVTIPSTEEAKEWDGWGSALKPANEPIVLARKPLEKGLSIAENVLKWGTGGINIDGCRVGMSQLDYQEIDAKSSKNATSNYNENPSKKYGDYAKNIATKPNSQGRFPANFIMTHHPDCVCVGNKKVKSDAHHTHKYNNKKTLCDASWKGWKDGEDMGNKFADENGQETIENWNCHEDCPIRIMDEQSGITKTGDLKPYFQKNIDSYSGSMPEIREAYFKGDKGGASRFFYCAKASKKERNKGLEGFEEKQKPDNYIMPKLTCSQCGSKRVDSNNKLVCGCNGQTHYEEQNSTESKNNLAGGNKNIHPTVKPISLMRYLVRLITPPNGIVLDPFNGSGTTGVACKLEGMNYVGMELDAEYCKIAQARIDNFTESDLEYEVEEQEEVEELKKTNEVEKNNNQLGLF